jgi:hypothetical protein
MVAPVVPQLKFIVVDGQNLLLPGLAVGVAHFNVYVYELADEVSYPAFVAYI